MASVSVNFYAEFIANLLEILYVKFNFGAFTLSKNNRYASVHLILAWRLLHLILQINWCKITLQLHLIPLITSFNAKYVSNLQKR